MMATARRESKEEKDAHLAIAINGTTTKSLPPQIARVVLRDGSKRWTKLRCENEHKTKTKGDGTKVQANDQHCHQQWKDRRDCVRD
ncbi:hypothetical protein RJT34_02557 [Clitoria ternatea]|uniref:Uncharacterized protein n=1 Tax=Clitoria ternatea TaxID=43366 RepID=A0AAN9KHW9_CLITE